MMPTRKIGPMAFALSPLIEGVIFEKRRDGRATLRMICDAPRAAATGKRPARVIQNPREAGMASLRIGLTLIQISSFTGGTESLCRVGRGSSAILQPFTMPEPAHVAHDRLEALSRQLHAPAGDPPELERRRLTSSCPPRLLRCTERFLRSSFCSPSRCTGVPEACGDQSSCAEREESDLEWTESHSALDRVLAH